MQNSKKFADDINTENFAGVGNNSNTGFVLRDDRYYFKDLTIYRINTTDDCNRIILRNPHYYKCRRRHIRLH